MNAGADQLLAAHFLAGNRRDALGVASAAGAAFSDVGLMPSSRLARLEALGLLDEGLQLMSALVGTDLGEGDVAPLVAASRGGGGELGFFVGRGLETATLADAFSRSLTEGAAAVIFGEAGIGKTTLVRRFVDDQVGHGVRAGWGAGTTDPRSVGGLGGGRRRSPVRRPVRVDGPERSDRQAIDSLLLPETGRVHSGSPADVGGWSGTAFLRLVVHLLRAWGEAGPVIVVIDDLHMAHRRPGT